MWAERWARRPPRACGSAPRSVTAVEKAAARPYLEVTRRELPWLVDELDGVAEGAGADPLAVFAASIEELAVPAQTEGRCTDLLAQAPATADGHLWVAHTNDLVARG